VYFCLLNRKLLLLFKWSKRENVAEVEKVCSECYWLQFIVEPDLRNSAWLEKQCLNMSKQRKMTRRVTVPYSEHPGSDSRPASSLFRL